MGRDVLVTISPEARAMLKENDEQALTLSCKVFGYENLAEVNVYGPSWGLPSTYVSVLFKFTDGGKMCMGIDADGSSST